MFATLRQNAQGHQGGPVLVAERGPLGRGALGLEGELPFHGTDIWNAWELTWLGPGGLPHVAIAEIRVPVESPNIVESKSMKLYLGSFAMSEFETANEVRDAIAADIGACVGSTVDVEVDADHLVRREKAVLHDRWNGDFVIDLAEFAEQWGGVPVFNDSRALRAEHAGQVVEQVVRPTGLVDPEVEVRPARSQVDDLLSEIGKRTAVDERVLVTTLTKRMAEKLSDYLMEMGVKVHYLHSEIDTLERVQILRDLRLGEFDVLVGINLLREGLDLPEVSLDVADTEIDEELAKAAMGADAVRIQRAMASSTLREADFMPPIDDLPEGLMAEI